MNEDSNTFFQPGKNIRPDMTEETAQHFVETLYGLKVRKVTEMNSYYDRNYKVEIESDYNNSYIDKLWPHGYMLKVLNSIDSGKDHAAAEHEVQHLLARAGILCPQPVLDREGRYSSLQLIQYENKEGNEEDKDRQMVRLFTFIPGDIIANYDMTPAILREAGTYLGKITCALKGYSHPALTSHQTEWNLSQLSRLQEFLHVINDPGRQKTVEEILEAFSKTVLPNLQQFQQGAIHGDYNDYNILVEKRPDPKTNTPSIRVCGVIDFGDMSQSFPVFDLAIAIMYMSLNCKENTDHIHAGGHVLSGYLKEMPLSVPEWKALRVCVAGRYCQSLVMGAYSYKQDPGNEYLLVTAKAGWTQLERLWRMKPDDLYNEWLKIIRESEPSIKLPEVRDIV